MSSLGRRGELPRSSAPPRTDPRFLSSSSSSPCLLGLAEQLPCSSAAPSAEPDECRAKPSAPGSVIADLTQDKLEVAAEREAGSEALSAAPSSVRAVGDTEEQILQRRKFGCFLGLFAGLVLGCELSSKTREAMDKAVQWGLSGKRQRVKPSNSVPAAVHVRGRRPLSLVV